MARKTSTCNAVVGEPVRRRVPISLTLDYRVLAEFKSWMRKTGRNNISDTIEGFIECGIRDTCKGCPYAENEKQEKIGIGKLK